LPKEGKDLHQATASRRSPQLTLPGLLGSGLAAALAGLCASLPIASFLHPQDVAVVLPSAWLWLRTAPLTTPMPLLLVLAGWLAVATKPAYGTAAGDLVKT
jgi:hypothetical protein